MVNTDIDSPYAIGCSSKGRQGFVLAWSIFFFMVYITHLSVNKPCGVQPNGIFQMFPTSVQEKKKENPQYFLGL